MLYCWPLWPQPSVPCRCTLIATAPRSSRSTCVACLVLKTSLKTDYRGVVAQLVDCPSLREAISLEQVPHYTTLQKATRRLLASVPVQRLLNAHNRATVAATPRAAGGHRLHRARMQLRERLLRAASGCGRNCLENGDLSPLSQTVRGLRCRNAFYLGLPSKAGRPRSSTSSNSSPCLARPLTRVRTCAHFR